MEHSICTAFRPNFQSLCSCANGEYKIISQNEYQIVEQILWENLLFLGLHIPRCILKSVNIALGYVLEHLLDPCKKRRKSYLYQICTSQFMNQMVKLHKIYLVVSQDDWSNKLKYNTCRGGELLKEYKYLHHQGTI